MRWFICLVLLICAIGAWWWVGLDADVDAGGGTPTRDVDGPDGRALDRRVSEIPTDRFVDRGVPQEVADQPETATTVVRGLFASVQHPDGSPVPDARVVVLPRARTRLSFASGASSLPLDLEYDRASDASGDCDLSDVEPGQWAVVARVGDRIGIGTLFVAEAGTEARGRREEQIERGWKLPVVVEGVRTINVVVRGSAGKPAAHVPVSVRDVAQRVLRSHRIYRVADRLPETWTFTDDEGRASFIARESDDAVFFGARRIEVAVHLHDGSVEKEVHAWEGASLAVNLKLERSPTVLDVTVVDADDRSLENDVTLEWVCRQGMSPWNAWTSPAPLGRVRVGGFVPGEYRFDVKSRFHENALNVSVTVEKPGAAGAQPVKFRLGDRHAMVELRVERQDGSTPAWGEYTLRAEQNGAGQALDSVLGWATAHAHEHGKYLFYVKSGTPGAVTIRETTGPDPGFGKQRAPVVTIPFDAIEPGATLDLGTTVMTPLPVLVSGRVVDSAGNPVAEADVSVSGTVAVPDSFRTRTSRSAAKTDEAGRFVVYAHIESEMAYSAKVYGYKRCRSIAFRAGQTDLELVVKEIGSMSGRIRVTHPRMRGALSCKLHGPALDYPRSIQPRAEGYFTTPSVLPGTYELVVEIGGITEGVEALRIGGLVVGEGEEARPDAIKDLIVGHGISPADVHVVGPDGKPLNGAYVQFNELGAGAQDKIREFESTNEEGLATVWCPTGTRFEIEVSSRDGNLQRRVIETDRFPVTVRMERPGSLDVTFTPAFPAAVSRGWRVLLVAPLSPEALERRTAARKKYAATYGRPVGWISPYRTEAARVAEPGCASLTFERVEPARTWRIIAQRQGWRSIDGQPVEVFLGEVASGKSGAHTSVSLTLTEDMLAALEACVR